MFETTNTHVTPGNQRGDIAGAVFKINCVEMVKVYCCTGVIFDYTPLIYSLNVCVEGVVEGCMFINLGGRKRV